ncbi:MAG: DUF6174 domain-containing protein [Thermoanaerobaculia bacterium]
MTRRTLWIVSALAVGLLAGWWVAGRSSGSDLTREDLEAARQLWESAGPASYTLVIETRGATGKRSIVEVRDGEVISMETGGKPASRSAWAYWTVDGLFDFLDTELRNAAAAEQTYGASPDQVVLQARFDDRLGYPRRFLRHVLGTRNGVEWVVESLTPRGGSGSAP